jgi:hypothetical protein
MKLAVRAITAAILLAAVAACSSGGGGISIPNDTAASGATTASSAGASTSDQTSSSSTGGNGGNGLVVTVDPSKPLGTISPLIRGLSGGADEAYIKDAGITGMSWGGNPSTRFNYVIGHAWNSAADWEYRNGNYGTTGDAAHDFVADATAAGAAVRLAVPTLGWIAKNDDNNTCSFPTDGGGCSDAGKANCKQPGPIADPTRANTESTPDMVEAWVKRMIVDQGLDIRFIAMDNEPDLWGSTHYDIHPTCPTYEEILDKYLTYASAVRAVAPKAELMGPVMCCWFSYWNTAPGPQDGSHEDFLPWFLAHVRDHDQQTGVRTLDVVDVHYYPQSDVYNDKDDPDTQARRLRGTRALWDPTYVDESWIDDPIAFIPSLKQDIAKSYPDTPIGISEWNFGADGTMNGALAIADALGIYGREGVYMANYWLAPKAQSPGYFAFKMFGNYDDAGSSFTGTALATTNPDDDVASYAALDPVSGHVKVMLVNKDPDKDLDVHVDLGSFTASSGTVHRYSSDDATSVTHEAVTPAGRGVDLTLRAYSITLLDLAP